MTSRGLTSLLANDNTVLKTKQPIPTPEAPTSSVFTNRISSSFHYSTKMARLPPLKESHRASITDAGMLTIVEEVRMRDRVIMRRLDNTVTAPAK